MFVNYNLMKNIKNITFRVRTLLAKDFAPAIAFSFRKGARSSLS